MRQHGPVVVFLGVIVESVIVPIPSPLIIMGAGALLIEPGLPPSSALYSIMLRVVLPGSIASTLGAYFAYGIAFWGGKKLVDRFQSFLGFSWDEIAAMEKRLEARHMGLMIFALRALPVVPLSLISAAAGVLRLPAASFAFWTLLGSVPRCLVLGYLGYLMRDTYEGLAGRLNSIETIISGAIVIGACGAIWWLRARMRAPRA